MTSDDSLNELPAMLRHVLQDLTHAVDRTLADRSLTFAKAMPLVALLDGERHTASSIARHGRCDAGAMTRIVSELEDRGLITRERSTEDRRVVYLQLTDTGHALAREVPSVLHDVMEVNLACLSNAERQMLTGLLRRIGESTDPHPVTATPDQAERPAEAVSSSPGRIPETDRQAAR